MNVLLGGPALVADAQRLAARFLRREGPRWAHTQAVAARAASATAAVPPEQRALLLAAAWVHDIGYARSLHRSDFHLLNGAWHLQRLLSDATKPVVATTA